MDTRGGVIVGSQVPTFEWVPEALTSAGAEAVEFAASVGLVMDPWQDHVLGGSLGEEPDGRWTVNQVGLIVPRQQGKGGVIEARELAGLFVFKEEFIIHSAHEFKTSGDAFRRMKILVEMNPELDRHVMKISESKGEEGFEFRIDKRTARLRYFTRTGSAGRGFTKANTVILDEAMILDEPPIAALLPTMATQPRWQVWYTASGGDIKLRSQSVVLARIRRRGYRREPKVAFFEWAAHLKHGKNPRGEQCPEDCVLDVRGDPRTWAKTCPAMGPAHLGYRVTEDFVAEMLGAMASWDFDREWLSAGEYPAEDGWGVIDETVWGALKDEVSKRGRRMAVGLETAWDGSVSTVSIASWRPDGFLHWEMLANRPGSAWMVDYAVALKPKHPLAFVVDPKGPASVVIQDLKDRRLKVVEPTLNEFAQWCAKTVQLVGETRKLRHLNQETMNQSMKVATKRDLGGGTFVWNRIDQAGDVTPTISGTLALGGLMKMSGKGSGRPLVGSA